MKLKNAIVASLALPALLCLTGCTTYYKVADPVSGKTYYTTDVDQNKNGFAQLVDARTGSKVTIQNSEISKISKDEYKAATKPN